MGRDNRITVRSTITFGIITGISIIIYWLFLRFTGLAFSLLDLRHVSVLILFFFTYRNIKRISSLSHAPPGHFTGFGVSMLLGATAYGISSAFLFLYLHVDKRFMNFLKEEGPFGQYLDPMNVAFWELSEGLGMQVIFSLIVMELFKALNRKNASPAD
jgi:hypothetical protein